MGGNPDKDATYLNVTPANNNGTTVHKLDVKDVPVDAFWSVSLYNAEGYFEKNPYDAYSVNNVTAARAPMGSHPVRRLRRQDRQLPADHERLELHRSPLSPAPGNSRRQVAVPGTETGQLNRPISW